MPQDSSTQHWYVLYTRPRFETKISREIRMLEQEYYLPMKTSVRRWSDRVKKITEPMFAGYIFLNTNLRHKADILQIPGVVRFVSTDGKPETISILEVERIRRIEASGAPTCQEQLYCKGDRVRVSKGVFIGLEGLLIRRANSCPRFVIQLPLLNQAISVEISVDDLDKIN